MPHRSSPRTIVRMPGETWDENASHFRPSTRVTLYVPVVVALLVQVPATVGISWWTRTPAPWAALSIALAAASALMLLAARRFPGATVAVVAGLAAADLFVPPEGGPPTVALAFAIIGAVVRGARVWALASVGAAWLATILLAGTVGSSWPPPRIALTTLGLALCFVIGEGIRSRFENASQRRLRLAERRRTAEQQERTRIARELHDVLAHSLSQIAVQSGVGLHLFDREPERAREALANIRSLSATGLDEVRGVLSFLRGDEPGSPTTAPLTPVPQLAQLSDLVQARSGLGLTVTLDDRLGEGAAPSSSTQSAGYRIVQEALTNVVRHSAASSATVTMDREADDLVVTVTDDGGGIRSDTPERGGIRGMRERAEIAGGTLAIRTDPNGTTVVARLPWTAPT